MAGQEKKNNQRTSEWPNLATKCPGRGANPSRPSKYGLLCLAVGGFDDVLDFCRCQNCVTFEANCGKTSFRYFKNRTQTWPRCQSLTDDYVFVCFALLSLTARRKKDRTSEDGLFFTIHERPPGRDRSNAPNDVRFGFPAAAGADSSF